MAKSIIKKKEYYFMHWLVSSLLFIILQQINSYRFQQFFKFWQSTQHKNRQLSNLFGMDKTFENSTSNRTYGFARQIKIAPAASFINSQNEMDLTNEFEATSSNEIKNVSQKLSVNWVKEQFKNISLSGIDFERKKNSSSSTFITHDAPSSLAIDSQEMYEISSNFNKQKLLATLTSQQTVSLMSLAEHRSITLKDALDHHTLQEHTDIRAFAALITAVKNGYIRIVHEVLEYDPFTEYYDQNGYSCLHLAVLGGRLNIVQLLLEHGAIINTKNHKGQNLLHTAIQQGQENILEYLLRKLTPHHEEILNGVDMRLETPLMKAAQKNNHMAIMQLISARANLNLQNKDGKTALMMTTERLGSSQSIRALLEAGARYEIPDHQGYTALLTLCNLQETELKQQTETILPASTGENQRYLKLSQPPKNTVSHQLSLVKLLIDAGSWVDQVNHRNETALILATKQRNKSLVKYLLNEKGAAIQPQDQQSMNAIDWARSLQLKEIEKILSEGFNNSQEKYFSAFLAKKNP